MKPRMEHSVRWQMAQRGAGAYVFGTREIPHASRLSARRPPGFCFFALLPVSNGFVLEFGEDLASPPAQPRHDEAGHVSEKAHPVIFSGRCRKASAYQTERQGAWSTAFRPHVPRCGGFDTCNGCAGLGLRPVNPLAPSFRKHATSPFSNLELRYSRLAEPLAQ